MIKYRGKILGVYVYFGTLALVAHAQQNSTGVRRKMGEKIPKFTEEKKRKITEFSSNLCKTKAPEGENETKFLGN